VLMQMLKAPPNDPVLADGEQVGEDSTAPHGLWSTLAWLVGLIVLSAVFGFVIALGVFFIVALRMRAGLAWSRVVILTSSGMSVLLVLAGVLNRDFPAGLLQELVSLPWPFK